jgi:predicted ATPase
MEHAAENGEYLTARQLLERARGISGETQAAILADPSIALSIINCIGHLAFVLWILGYSDEARQQEARIITLLSSPLDPIAGAVAIGHVLTIHHDLVRDHRTIPVHAEKVLARSIQSGSGYLASATGSISLGRLMVAGGSVDAGIEKIAAGMFAFQAAGDERNYYMWSYMAIAADLDAYRFADGRALTERAISQTGRAAVRLFEADLYRLKGEFLLMTCQPENEAEAVFREAISIARHRRAKSFELRATISLARLLATQGREKEAHRMLAGIYSWFTEGFDTADLRDAKALLDELGP